jgi:two-component system CheB/CheR fusion protein
MNDESSPPITEPSARSADFLVVGVGASAGALDGLKRFLAALPPAPNYSLVLIEHAAESESELLGEDLARLTPLPVLAIEEAAVLAPGRLYVAPPDAIVGVKGARFRLRPPRTASERRNPVDRFFHALAEAYGTRAVGIVLPGASSDGALGLEAVGAAGGMTMAQAPGAPATPDMPASVAAAADHVLPPEELAQALEAYARHWGAITSGRGLGDRRREIQARVPEICDVLLRRTGHDFKHYKTTTLVRRIERRMQVRALRDVDSYLGELARDLDEPHVLFRDLLIGVTSFFREPEAFAALSERVVATLLAERSSSDQIRIWVPGCATGEEAYSIAMLVREQLDRADNAPAVQIFATDVNERSLVAARRGSYPQGIALQMSPERLARFFVKRGRRYQVTDELREMCLFSVHNLISDPPFSRLDLISCRNLLIYLGSHLQKKLIPVFHYALRQGGFLFLGASESLTGHNELFRVIDAKHRIAQRKDAAIRVPGQMRDFAGAGTLGWRSAGGTGEADLGAVAQRILLDEFAPRYVIASEDGQVVFLSEGVDVFIQPPAGTFSNNLMRMVRRGLSIGLRTAFNQAVQSRRTVVRDVPAVHTADGLQSVRVTVQPMPEMGREDGLYMVVFQERGPPLRRTEDDRAPHPDADAVIEGLERELLRTREDLERAVQDLEAANEELKSSNEELLSMNEELQSANEELETSKEDVQAANQALLAGNADLENLLRSTRIATIFLDPHGLIRSFTPAATEIYNVAPADVGRSLGHFTHRLIDLPPLPSLAELQEATGAIEHEAPTDDGRWFVRRALPYRTTDGAADGYVISFVDVTRQKESERAVREGEARYRSLFEQAAVGIKQVTLEDGRILDANQKLCDILGYSRDELLQRTYADLTHPEDVIIEGDRLRRLASGEVPNYAVEKRYRRKDGSFVWVRVTSSLAGTDPTRPYRISIVEDIEERKRAEDAQRETAERLLLALSAARMGDWRWDAATDMVTMSEAAAELFGIAPGPLMTWADMRGLMPDQDRDRAAAAVVQAVEEKSVYNIEYRVRRPATGEVAWVAAMGRGVYGSDGAVRGMIGIVQDVTERMVTHERQALLIRELHHRVKNTLATVQAIVGSTARSATSIDDFYEAFVGRIVSLAHTHNLLTEDFWQTAPLQELLQNELGPYDDDTRTRVVMGGPPVELPSSAAVPVGMAIHELTTNAAKYGALSVMGGRIEIAWDVVPGPEGPRLTFAWTEHGGPRVSPPQRQGFGSRLLQRVLTTQLQAQVTIDFEPEGLRFRMDAPLPEKPGMLAAADG